MVIIGTLAACAGVMLLATRQLGVVLPVLLTAAGALLPVLDAWRMTNVNPAAGSDPAERTPG